MWNRHAELELLWPIAQVFRNENKFWIGRIKQAPEFGAIMREHLAERLAFFEHELGTRPYIAGQRFTVADITALCAIDFGKVSNIRLDPATHPNLVSWHARVSERPSAKA
jgi:glutathione S-transferase